MTPKGSVIFLTEYTEPQRFLIRILDYVKNWTDIQNQNKYYPPPDGASLQRQLDRSLIWIALSAIQIKALCSLWAL